LSLYSELKRRHVFKVAGAYAVVSWVLIQIASVISQPLSLPGWFETVVLAFLGLGFPVAMILAWAFDLSPAAPPQTTTDDAPQQHRGNRFAAMASGAIVAVAIMTVAGFMYWYQGADERIASTEGLEELRRFIDASEWEAAYAQARSLDQLIPGHPTLENEWPKLSWASAITTEPAGARIYRREYRQSDDEWEFLGPTPIEDLRVPFGLSVLRAELDGYETAYQLVGGNLQITEDLTPNVYGTKTFDIAPETMRLDKTGQIPDGMIRVPGWRASIGDQQVEMEDFFLGRFEVTNEEFKSFVDSGGYESPEYWEESIVVDGKAHTWQSAMGLFVDRTGQNGPTTWLAGDYPEGEGNHPVGGVSWYEAMAYAKFVGQSLPTVHHWRRAFALGALAWMIPESNIGASSTMPVGSNHGISWSGHYDMVGNVREWTVNNIGGERHTMGGAWGDERYVASADFYTRTPWDRNVGNGFRLAVIRDTPQAMALARAPVEQPAVRDIRLIEPVSADVFEAYRNLFAYESTPLNVTMEARDSDRLMDHQYVEIDAAYPQSRLPIHVYVPKSATPPYQAVIYWPGSIVNRLIRYEDFKFQFDFLLKSGRMVAFPIYDGSFGRDSTGRGFQVTNTASFREILTRTVKDLRRTIDYLESRPDVDQDRLAFFGNSMGAYRGSIGTAIDDRFDVSILYILAILEDNPPDADPLTYLPFIHLPTLLLSGEYDPFSPPEAATRPAFERIGTSSDQKRLVIAPGGHFVPHDVLVRESLAWLDKYLGKPRRR
jgi:formylglycine-generating enzyme required for sulfatase activity/pimeloyl-ACP methyl ester carboxylesterase